MAWTLPLVPLVLGAVVWWIGERSLAEPSRRRAAMGSVAVVGLLVVIGLAAWAAVHQPRAALRWSEGLALTLHVTPLSGVAALVVPVIALPIVAWAAAHEDERGLPRLLGLLVAFVGAMELLVLAADLLALSLSWELVGALSWALIGHHAARPKAASAASYAFVATRAGGLGLWIAAGAALATTGSLGFDALPRVAESPWGHALAGGILLAAAAKSAQGPFAAWLFRAMEGPSSVSALLHSSTMVAAGAWLLVRLHEPLALVPWLGPAAIGLGLATALAGGVVALCQRHAKRLLAASTSAQHGLVFAAVGMGSAGAGAAHLVTHAAAKALLFLAAGTALTAAGSARLDQLRLGRRLPIVAIASAVGALALAAVPPLGMGWSKELIVVAAEHVAPWLAALTMVAGVLGAAYAARFQRLAFGPPRGGEDRPTDAPASAEASVGTVARASMVGLAVLCVALGVAWLPGLDARVRARLPEPPPQASGWVFVVSVASVVLAVLAVWIADRRGVLQPAALRSRRLEVAADWLGLPAALRVLVVTPTRRLATACAEIEARLGRAVTDGLAAAARDAARMVADGLERGFARAVALVVTTSKATRLLVASGLERALAWTVERVARGTVVTAHGVRRADELGFEGAARALATATGRAGGAVRRIQTGAIPTYYALAAAGVLVLGLALHLGS